MISSITGLIMLVKLKKWSFFPSYLFMASVCRWGSSSTSVNAAELHHFSEDKWEVFILNLMFLPSLLGLVRLQMKGLLFLFHYFAIIFETWTQLKVKELQLYRMSLSSCPWPSCQRWATRRRNRQWRNCFKFKADMEKETLNIRQEGFGSWEGLRLVGLMYVGSPAPALPDFNLFRYLKSGILRVAELKHKLCWSISLWFSWCSVAFCSSLVINSFTQLKCQDLGSSGSRSCPLIEFVPFTRVWESDLLMVVHSPFHCPIIWPKWSPEWLWNGSACLQIQTFLLAWLT